ncbi:hypothetical protein [Spirosoma spitsbergense]|uniref:hypothetical protein n=1 Tax=Spirosoma spitsbergense TaxID=431554 RepID=UPI0003A8484A|nr:hypothetical protein [Spirosoma spitsbergense]
MAQLQTITGLQTSGIADGVLLVWAIVVASRISFSVSRFPIPAKGYTLRRQANSQTIDATSRHLLRFS